MQAAVPLHHDDLEPLVMSEEEYLAFADEQEIKYEYCRGRVYAMTGASVRHNIVCANAIIHIGNQLSDQDCTVTSSDTRVHIASKDRYRYPDVTVFCGEAGYLEGRTDTITNPILLVEVSSPGTELKDRNEKLEEYTQIETLQAYLLVAQDQAKVELFTRHESGQWLFSIITGMDGEVALPALDCTLALSKLYQKVSFDEAEDAEETT